MDDDPDQILMRRVAAGEPGAMETLQRRYGRYIRKVVGQQIADRAAADDVVQEVLVRLWRTANRFDRSLGSLSTWVAMITRRRAYDAVRHNARAKRGLPPALSPRRPEDDPTERFDDAEEAERMVRRVLRDIELSDPERARVLSLVYLCGMTCERARAELGIPMGTLKTRLTRGLADLRMANGGPAARPQRKPRTPAATAQPAPTTA